MKKIALFITIAILPFVAQAQYPQLVADLSAGKASSAFSNAVAFDHRLLFVVTTAPLASQPSQLYITDGSASGTQLLKGFLPNTQPSNFTMFNSKMFFLAGDSSNIQQLWVTDGTPAGTQVVKSIYNGVGNALAVMNGTLYFLAKDSTHGTELWRTDGTTTGTYMLPGIDIILKKLHPAGELIAAHNQ